MCKDRLKRIFMRMEQRCNNSHCEQYLVYGEKGIKLLWITFKEFEKDMRYSYDKHIKLFGEDNTQIERINNNGNYSKENCRWATRKEQNRNKSNNAFLIYRGKNKTKAEWAEKLNIPYTNFLSLLRTRDIKSIIKYRHLFKSIDK